MGAIRAAVRAVSKARMAGRGPAPKPAYLRQRTNRKPGAAALPALPARAGARVPELPAGFAWHSLTLGWWKHVWTSPMAGEYLPSDVDGLGRVALLVDAFYREQKPALLAEIRLQESRFGLSPLDRSRLQWEIERGDEADRKLRQRAQPAKRVSGDPRALLRAVK